MNLDVKNEEEKTIEELKKERDLLLLKDEINRLKRAEQRDKKIRKAPKLILNFVVYFLAVNGAGLLFSGVFFGRGDQAEIIVFGCIFLIPLALKMFKERIWKS